MDKAEIILQLNIYCKSATRKRARMAESTARALRHYVAAFLRNSAEPLSRDSAIRAVHTAIKTGTRKASSQRTACSLLCQFLTDIALITSEDANRITSRFPAPAPDWSDKALSRDELHMCLNELNLRGLHVFSRARDYTMFATMLLTGIRVSQAIACSNYELTHDNFIINVPRLKNRVETTVSKHIPTSVVLPDLSTYGGVVRAYLTMLPANAERLFCTRRGMPMSDSYVRKIFASLSSPTAQVHAHALRHTAGTIVANNVSVPAAAQLLDHVSITTTMRYIKQERNTANIIKSAWEQKR